MRTSLFGLLAVTMLACGDDSAAGAGGVGGTGGESDGGQAAGGLGGSGGAGGAPSSPALTVRNAETHEAVTNSLTFEPLEVIVSNVEPNQPVSIRATLGTYQSQATFVAHADGTVNTSLDAPSSGSYEGADADGLIYSMAPFETPAAFGDTVVFELVENNTAIASQSVVRAEYTPSLTRLSVSLGAGFVGVVYLPDTWASPGRYRIWRVGGRALVR